MTKAVFPKIILAAACVLTVGLSSARAASVGVAGYTNAFATGPAAADWSTFSLAGAAADIGDTGGMQTTINNNVTAAMINGVLAADTANPPVAGGPGVYSSSGQYLQTRPTGNAASLIMCTLVNGLGQNAGSVTISHDFARVAEAGEQVEGYQAFYSLSGATGSWTPIPELSGAIAVGRLTATINFVWTNGTPLYVLWADDNATPASPDTAMQLDNFSATATPDIQTAAVITADPQNQTVAETTPASFTVGVGGNPPPTIQWLTNNVAVTGATNLTFNIAETLLAQNGMAVRAVAENTASNVNYSATSAVATLTVNADTVRPVLQGAVPSGLNQVVALFSERLSAGTANAAGNYGIAGLIISNAVLDSSQSNVVITTSPMTPGATYTLVVNNVADRSAAANTVLPNSQVQFTAALYAFSDIGSPATGGSAVTYPDGADLTARGTNVGGVSDQFSFSYLQRAEDFDVKVRVDSLTLADNWTKAGLMARDSTAANGRFAASFATPSASGSFFMSRATAGAAAVTAGMFPVNYPDTWLRLRRQGDTFTGYASFDGSNWSQLGSVLISGAPRPMLLGMAATSANTSQSTTARFRQLMDVPPGTGTIGNVTLTHEPAGPSSRNTGLAITEIMYHPKETNALEFIEIYNADLIYQDMSGFRISGDVNYTFPPGTTLPAGGFLVVARNPAALTAEYGAITALYGPWTDDSGTTTATLPDDEGRIRLRNRSNAVLLEINYRGLNPWPLAADGSGHSLVLARPSYGEDNYRAWDKSSAIGGTPGAFNPVGADPLDQVVINEFLAHTDLPSVDYIELFNKGSTPVTIGGAYLSDDRDTNKFQIPPGTVLGPRSFIAFNVATNTTGFALSSGGERIYFVNAAQTRVIDMIAFGGQANGVSSGRSPDGAPTFHELRAQTPGTNNAPLLLRDVVINEIMYSPISGNDDEEYIELYNKGTNAVDLSNWRFSDGIDYQFPVGTILPTNAYLVVGSSPLTLLANHGGLTVNNTFGPYSGSLGNGGERVALSMPDYFLVTNNNVVSTQAIYIEVDEVIYGDTGRWGEWADGGGSSLELIDPRSDNRQAQNWADSDETTKAPWTTIERATRMANSFSTELNEIQIFLLGRGECLVDNVEVRNVLSPSGTTGNNLVANGDLESGITGWFLGGNHIRSSLNSAEGFGGSTRSLYLRASGGGDNGANRVEKDLTLTLAEGQTNMIQYRARWLRGYTNILARPHSGGMEAPGTLIVPANLGTPGARNSRFRSNGAPAIWDVAHKPVLPAANEGVVVTARVHDPDPLGGVQLRYHAEASATFSTIAMLDNGTGGDAAPNDGVYSATIPGQASGVLFGFQVSARDTGASPATNTFPANSNVEAYVRWGESIIPGNLGVYRLWMSTSNLTLWAAREELSNEPLDGTMVYGNFRVVYNAGARWRGSPFLRPSYNTPTGTRCAYVWTTPGDDELLGADELNLDSLEPGDRDATILREPTSFWMADQLGLSFSYQRYVHIVINGIDNRSRGIPAYADTQQPDSAYLASWFADDGDGEIFKIDDWFEFDDSITGPGRQNNINANLANYNTATLINGVLVTNKDQARYRNSWEKKFNKNLDDNYSSLFSLVDALNSPAAVYVTAVENAVDTESYATAFMLRHAIGDWDGYGYDRGKNQFTYRSHGGKFQMLLWDLDFSLGCTGGHPPTQNMFQVNDGVINTFYNNVHMRRACFRAMQRMVDGPFRTNNATPIIEARYRALQANGVVATSPFIGSGQQGISIPTWIDQRRNNLVGQIPAAPFAVSGASFITISSNLVTLSGTAPVLVSQIYINGIAYPVTWTSTTAWTLRAALTAGTNVLQISGVDLNGNTITASQSITVVYTGATQQPDDFVVINEIMSNPSVPGAEYVELFNTSSNFTFDLAGFEFNGLDYTFPEGGIIPPRAFLVLARDPVVYANAYGVTAPVFGRFDGNLQANGETISLIKPAVTNAMLTNAVEVVIDRVRYEPVLPWPVGTNGVTSYSSIQLIDSRQDNSRPCNWSTLYHPPTFAGATNFPGATNAGWRQVIHFGTNTTASGTNFWVWTGLGGGEVYVDDVYLARGFEPESGTNLLINGDFEQPLGPAWEVLGNHSNTVISTSFSRTGTGSLRLIGSGLGSTTPSNGVRQFIVPPDTNRYTLSYWYYSTMTATTMQLRTFPGSSLISLTNVQPQVIPAFSNGPMQTAAALFSYTPGSNNVRTTNITAIPAVWLNELQTSNVVGIVDNAGDRDPWIELYNSSTGVVSLAGLYLANNYDTNLTQWQFPAGASIAPGEFKIVWADGEPGETSGTNLHTSFRLGGTAGSLALVRISNNTTQVLDYLSYVGTGPALSYGDFPSGQPFYRQTLFSPTPRSANVAQAFPVFVNEWMAGNSNAVADPADGNFEDWFEIYNAGLTDLDLGGFYLTDELGNPKFRVPDNGQYVIPPGGFLLVWADNETNQNNMASAHLHASFQLGLGGEPIAIYAPDGETLVTSITFGQQTNDISQGRFADGSDVLYFMTLPTPGSANTIGGPLNTAPVIPPIATRTNRVGQNISFQITATDAEAPPQTLTLSLLGFPPSGAGITTGGLFTWTPDEEYGYTTNVFTVRARDDGSPALSTTRNFTIIVLPPLAASVSASGNTVTISFDTIPGRTYRVDYKNSLNDAMWTPLAPAAPAAGTSVMIMDDMTGQPHRFYRIEQTD